MTIDDLLMDLDMGVTELAIYSDSVGDELDYYDMDNIGAIPHFVLTADVKKWKARTDQKTGHLIIYVYI